MIKTILWIWQLPQHILALILIKFYKGIKSKTLYKNSCLIKTNKEYNYKGAGAVSLGQYILIDDNLSQIDSIVKHEYGHSIQSIIFGWFYLLFIGFFSYGNNFIWRKLWDNGKRSYYSLFPERWADILGKTDNRKR